MATPILPVHFCTLTVLGIWCPLHWSTCKKNIYFIYSSIMFTLMLTLDCCQMSKLLFTKVASFSEFNEIFSFNVAMQAAVIKAGSYLFNKNKVVRLIHMFEEDCCVARDDFERNIYKTCEDKCKRLAKVMFIAIEMLVVSFMITPLGFDIELRILPYPVLLPYSVSNLVVYWFEYCHQVITGYFVGHIAIISDLVTTGFMWHLCGQLKILQHRLQKLNDNLKSVTKQRQVLIECVQHHVHLYNIGDAITAAFSVYVIFQFYCDALGVCMSVYQFSTTSTTIAAKLAFFSFVSILLGRLFLMCYFGNEVALQSEHLVDVIFNIDWTPFSLDVKKSLLMMIMRSSKPMIISNRFFVSLTLDTFIKVIKISYSGYNLLKSSV